MLDILKYVFYHDSEAFWSFICICFASFVPKSPLGIARQWSREKFAILPLKARSQVRILSNVSFTIRI